LSTTLLDRDLQPQIVQSRPRVSLKRAALAGAALALLTAGAWFAYDWWNYGRFIESTDDAYVGGNLTSIAPHVGGFIESIPVTDYQLVQAGQVVLRLDRRDYQAALDHAKAVVASATATLDSLRAQVVQQQSAIQQQAAGLAAKSAQAEYTAADAERYRSLATTAAGSRQDQQRTTSLDAQARAGILEAAAALQVARQRVPVLEAEIAKANADVAQAQADLQTAQLNLSYTEIRAPIEGYIGNRAAQIGAYVGAGGYLLSIIPSSGLWVDANFKEDQLADMATGRAASITADVLPGHVFHGHVVNLSPGTGAVFSVIPPENATGNFTKIVQRVPVRIALDGNNDKLTLLRPGLSTNVHVDTRAEKASKPSVQPLPAP
jgi:membrane fusion protein (multidrug efflux system)